MESSIKADKMGAADVKKLMLSMGLPIVMSMALQAVYNIVDSAFLCGYRFKSSGIHMDRLAYIPYSRAADCYNCRSIVQTYMQNQNQYYRFINIILWDDKKIRMISISEIILFYVYIGLII